MRIWHDFASRWVALTLLSIFNIPCWSQTPPLKLISASPANNATDVSRTVTPTLNFSTTLNRASVSPTRVTMSAPSGVQPINLSVTDSQLTLLPRNKLLPITKYTLNVSGVRGINGEALAAPVNTAFITRDGAWQTASLITHPPSVLGTASLAENATGAAFIAWLQFSPTREHVIPWSSRYLPGLGWSKPVMIQLDETIDAQSVVVAVDHSGNALALWSQYAASHWSLRASRYTRGVGWGTAKVIANDAGLLVTDQQIAFDADDNALVVWAQPNSFTGKSNIYAVRYNVASGWGVAETIDGNVQNMNAYSPAVRFDAQGNATSIWQCNPDNVTYQLCTNRYVAGTGWGEVAIIATASYNVNSDAIYEARLAVSSSGVAFAVWTQNPGIYASRYTSAGGWESPTLVDDTYVYDLKLATSAAGDAILTFVWRVETPQPHFPSAGHYVVGASHYSAATGWEPVRGLQANDAYDAQMPEAVMDASGNGMVAWSGYNGFFYRIYTTRYRADTGWTDVRKVIDTTNTNYSSNPVLAVDQSGDVLAVWLQAAGANDPLPGFWENRFQ